MNNNLKEILLIALGKQDAFSHTLTEDEWNTLYAEAEKQSLIGICFAGVERLSKEQQPDLDLLMEWLGQTEYIKTQNKLISDRATELTHILRADGKRSVVLKGQGVALLYKVRGESFDNSQEPRLEVRDLSLLRTSGDIDLWIDGSRDETLAYLRSKGWKVGKTVIHHADVEIFPDVETEIHFIPSYTYSPFRYRKYLKWFKEQAKVQFQLFDKSVGFAYPSIGYNLVYSLLHIFRHVFHEGIGLRQILDYYFILTHSDSSTRREAMNTLRWIGLKRFVSAIMYVEHEVFDLDDKYLLCKTDAEAGKFLLDEIMITGNFGHYNEATREAHVKGDVSLYLHNVGRLFKMLKYYPSEVLWSPIWKPVHFLWRKYKGY